MSRIRVLYISHLHPAEGAPLQNMGGMQRVSMQLVDALGMRGDVQLHTEILHAHWKGIAARTVAFALGLLLRLPRLVAEKRIDVVLFSSMVTAALAPLVRHKVKVPLVAINHGRDITLPVGLYQAYLKKVFRSLDATISVSTATRMECLTRGMPPSAAFVLPNGLPVGSRAIQPDKVLARRQLLERHRIPVDGRLILSVGRQVKRKGHLWFIEEVMPLLTGTNRVVLVGDGPEHGAIMAQTHRWTDTTTLHVLGRIGDDELSVAYDAADVFVMPNIPVAGDMEGFGIVMIEANMRGVPVVASNLEGIKDVVREGVNGNLVEPLNAPAFAYDLNRIRTDEDPFDSATVANHVVASFGWEAIAGNYVQLLRSVMSRSLDGTHQI